MHQEKEMVRRAYNIIARDYLALRKEGTEDVKLLDELVKRLPEKSVVLDAGCGGGVPVARLLSRYYKVTGVDISEAQVRLAQEMVPAGNFICADMTRLCFREGSFDAICSYYAIIHVPREEHAGILRDFYRILRPGGLALLCLGAGDLPESVEKYLNGVEVYWSHYDAKTNIRLLEGCGFRIIWYRLVKDSTDPKSKSVHLFVLAGKREKAGRCRNTVGSAPGLRSGATSPPCSSMYMP